MKSKDVIVLMSAGALFISLLTGFNQVTGFFTKVTVPTAIFSVVLAVIVALAFPVLLQRKLAEEEKNSGSSSSPHNAGQKRTRPAETFMKTSYRGFCLILALLILIAGVGPFLGKWRVAAQARQDGAQLLDRDQLSPARLKLERAARYYADLGLDKAAAEAKLVLSQVYAGVGNTEHAKTLIDEVENSGALDGRLQGKLDLVRGILAYERGEYVQAERFYDLAKTTLEKGSKDEAILLQNQGVLWEGKGAPFRERVLENYRQAKEIYQQHHDPRGVAHILVNEGNLYESDPQLARTFYEQALREAEQDPSPKLVGTITMNLGYTYRLQGQLQKAEELYNRARRYFEDAADLAAQADVLVNMATLEQIRGRMEVARQHLQASESYLRNVDLEKRDAPPRKLARIRTFQADIYDTFGESAEADRLYKEALEIYARHPDPLAEAGTRVNYAALLLRLNRGEETLQQIGRAREILEAYSDENSHQAFGVLNNNLGKAHQDIGDFETALVYYQKSADIFADLIDFLMHAQARENMGIVRLWLDDAGGEADIEQALAIYRHLENRDHEVKALFNLYSARTSKGDPSAGNTVRDIMRLLDTFHIDQIVESSVLLGILVQDIGDQSDLIRFRERLLHLRAFYGEREEHNGLGRSLLKLAGVEQALGNYDVMEQYAYEAAAYAESIPLPMRISYHTDLGFYLVVNHPNDGIDHFLSAFDLAEGWNVDLQRNLAVVIETYIALSADEIDVEKYLNKARFILENATDPEIKRLFQQVVEHLRPSSG